MMETVSDVTQGLLREQRCWSSSAGSSHAKPLQSRGQRAVPEGLEGWHGVGSYGAGRGAPALLLDGSV